MDAVLEYSPRGKYLSIKVICVLQDDEESEQMSLAMSPRALRPTRKSATDRFIKTTEVFLE